MPITSGNHGLINKFRDSAYGELNKGDRLTVHPPYRTGHKDKLPTYVFELVGFNPGCPEVARAKVIVDGEVIDETQRIDFELIGSFKVDRTVYLTGDSSYGSVPVYLQRLGSDYTEVV